MADPSITVEELAKKAELPLLCLDKAFREEEACLLAEFCDQWELIGYHLRLVKTDITTIKNDNDTTDLRRISMLVRWSEKFAHKATYRVLIEALIRSKHGIKALELCQTLRHELAVNSRIGSDADAELVEQKGAVCTREDVIPDTDIVQSIKDLRMQFVRVQHHFLQSGPGTGVTLQQLQTCISTLPSFTTDKPQALLEASSVQHFIHNLKDYCCALNPDILEGLIEVLGDVKSKSMMEKYKRVLHEFRCKTKLKDFVGNYDGPTPPEYKEVQLKLGDDWREKTLADLILITSQISRQSWLVKMVSVGSMYVRFMIPQDDDLELGIHIRNFLQSQCVLQIVVGGVCIFNCEGTSALLQTHHQLRGSISERDEDEAEKTDCNKETGIRSRMSIAEKRICEGVLDTLLDSKVSEFHLAEIASDLVNWELLAPTLHITESEQKEIKEDFKDRYNLQKRQALHVWRWKNGEKATYRNLISICCSQRLISMAETISQYAAGSRRQPRSTELVDSTFYHYLLDCYRGLLHPNREQWPSKEVPHIIPSTFFDLILYEAPLSEVDRSSSETLKSVTLSSILKKDETDRLLVYFEGIAGSGKTTLSWHISREWAHKRLLEQFQILIYLQLNDPQVQSATHFSDIIPYPDKILQQQIASEILDRQGQGICFLLDGLDEAPTSLLDLLVDELIIGRPGGWQLPRASYIMTSRPAGSVTTKLKSFLSSRVIIEGFSSNNLNQFLDASLGTMSEKEMLLSKFELNPRLQGLCCHPINAVIICFLTLFMKEDLPTTHTNLYKPLVCNCLIRHMDTHKAEKQSYDIMIDNLTDDSCIPPQIRKPFRIICRLAYSSVLKNKQLFTAKEIREAQVDNVLGFLKVHPKITMYGSERYYSFFHLSLQEFLAAVCLSKKSEATQVKAIQKILNRNPLSQVLHFYAGLTSLSNNQALKLLSQSLSEAADYVTIKTLSPPNDPRPWLPAKALTFLNCLYESQNEALLNLPETHMLSNENAREAVRELQMRTSESLPDIPLEYQPTGTLMLHHLPLTPIDCLSIGHYIRIKSLTKIPSFPRLYWYSLQRCFIDHIGIRILFTEIKKNISQRTPCHICLDISDNTLYRVSLPMLKDFLQGQSNLQCIILRNCFLSTDLPYALKYLTEGLSNNSSCTFVCLSENQISALYVYHLILMLRTSPQLTCLTIDHQDLRRGLYLLWKALQLLPYLQFLDMSSCNIHDPELALLQEVVRSHPRLQSLNIYDNHFTHSGLCNLLKVLVGNSTSILIFLGLDIQLDETEERILKKINQFRTSIRRLSLILRSLTDTTLAKQSIY